MNFDYLALDRIHVSVCITLCICVLSFADSMLVCALADSYVSALRRSISNGE